MKPVLSSSIIKELKDTATLFLRPKFTTVIIHVVAWICFVFFPFVFLRIRVYDTLFLVKTLISLVFLAAFFYTHLLILLPAFLKTRKRTPYFLSVLFMVGLLLAEESLTEYFFLHKRQYPVGIAQSNARLKRWEEFNKQSPDPLPPRLRNRNFFPFFFFAALGRVLLTSVLALSVSGALRITDEWAKNERQKKEMENERLSTELGFLKSQINPHFLFNTLNNIYSLANRKSDDTSTAIIKLSQLMRYMLYESNDRIVSLSREIDYLKNYIDLQRLRFSDDVQICFSTVGDPDDKMVAPMLFIHFVENAFKFGTSYDDRLIILIWVKSTPGQLYFKVQNHFDPNDSQHVKNGTSGIGLQNVTRRLNLLYPEQHQLVISRDEEEHMYTVELTLTLAA